MRSVLDPNILCRAAALVMAEYEEAFDGNGVAGPSRSRSGARGAFVRAGGGEAYTPDARLSRASRGGMYAFQDEPGSSFDPPKGPAAMGYGRVGFGYMSDLRADRKRPARSLSPPPAPKPKGKRALHSFLEEIKTCVTLLFMLTKAIRRLGSSV